MSQDTRIEIYGHSYSIRTDLDPAYIQQLAEVVNARMNALSHQTGTVDTRRLAVLAALNLADELQELRKSLEAQRHALPADVARRLEECNRRLGAALGQGVLG
jgi:cell division protein ZapA (FtsZ GTPase activity inhibitor)